MPPNPPPQMEGEIEIEIDVADASEIGGMCSIFRQAFSTEEPKLFQAMYAGLDEDLVLETILQRHLHSAHSKFMIAFDVTEGIVPDPSINWDDEDLSHFEKRMSYGWISVGVVPQGADLNSYAASDLSAYTSLKLLAREAQARGEDPRRPNINDPRFRLACGLMRRSRDGQATFVAQPYLCINYLALWPECHDNGGAWDMASQLLGWAVQYAERHGSQIWTQILAKQVDYFRQAGFIEVRAFTLNLNDYASSRGTDLGMQEWVQMVYTPPIERRAR